MSVLAGKELRIVGFLCNWCSYGGADTAGTARAVQPTDLRIIRVPCSGRVNPLFILKALINGADGVLVSGCHPRDCHYSAGNYYARRRLEMLKQFLPVLGINPDRFASFLLTFLNISVTFSLSVISPSFFNTAVSASILTNLTSVLSCSTVWIYCVSSIRSRRIICICSDSNIEIYCA